MNLDSKLEEIKGIGPKLSSKYHHLGLDTVYDLLFYSPRKFEDYSLLSKISQLKPGKGTVEGQISSTSSRYVRRGMHITEAIAKDSSGSLRLIWFNQPYREKAINKGTSYYISGEYRLSHQRFSMINPSMELTTSFPISTARILPIYPETKGLTSRDIRKALVSIMPLINDVPESLPKKIIKEYKLLDLTKALKTIHFPENSISTSEAKKRLAFDELFALILTSELNKLKNAKEKAPAIKFNQDLAKTFVKNLTFSLTNDQRKAIWQIYLDMSKSSPMNRLVEGEVGSGKTIVAAMAALMVLNKSKKAFLMAPTELLANQHYQTIKSLFKPLKLDNNVGLLTSKSSINPKANFIVGTHALLYGKKQLDDLGLVIIDEQHRFGVDQRKAIEKRAKKQPHLLSLSATPIPRSLALTMFGELSISRLKEMPSKSRRVETKVISRSALNRQIGKIKKLLNENQMYVVCPTIKESDKSDKLSVEQIYKEIKRDYKDFKVEVLHGQLSSLEKDRIITNFASGKIDILVSTSIIEVGIDVPRANIMVVMSSDSFGLAQLHQLRGRIGRGEKPGLCYLVHQDNQPPGKRLRAIETINDGFKLAEIDLEIRGPGLVYGTFQSGFLRNINFADLTDIEALNEVKKAVLTFVRDGYDLLKYPRLANQVRQLQKITNLDNDSGLRN